MTTNEALDQYLSSLGYAERVAKSRDIRVKIGISRAVLSDWRRGRTRLHPIFLDKISEVLGVDLSSRVDK